MLDLRAPTLPADQGELLSNDAYRRDFLERNTAIRNGDSWKLERLQHFEEQSHASRDALRRGNWQEALRLIDAGRDAHRASALDAERRGSAFHRVRVVEEPLTPYLQWELHLLRLRAECGHRIRVLPAEAVKAAETNGLMPELTLLDSRTLYRVLYTDTGVPDGAVRYTDPHIVDPWASYLRDAYAVGEDIAPYFDRVVAPLPPPVTTPE